MNKYNLRLTELADHNLDDLYEEGYKTWGVKQADSYYEGLMEHFERLCKNPMMYQSIDNIREGYRRSVSEKHAIYYVIYASLFAEVRNAYETKDKRPLL